MLKIHATNACSYNPKSDGMVELSIGQLSIYFQENQYDWDVHLPFVTTAYRSTVHESTGFPPYLFFIGREVFTPLDLLFGAPPDNPCEIYVDYVVTLRDKMVKANKFRRLHLIQAE